MYVPEDGGSDGDGLDISDRCWAAEQSDVGRERRLQTRLAYIHTYIKFLHTYIHTFINTGKNIETYIHTLTAHIFK